MKRKILFLLLGVCLWAHWGWGQQFDGGSNNAKKIWNQNITGPATGAGQCLISTGSGPFSLVFSSCGSGGSSTWATLPLSGTNTGTGEVLSPTATGTVARTLSCPTSMTVDCQDWNINGTNELNIVEAGGLLVFNPANGGFIDANRSRWGSNNIAFNPSVLPTSGQCLGYDGTYISGTNCGSGGGLPINWTQNGTTGSVLGTVTPSQDGTTLSLTPALSSGGTKNIFEVGDHSLTPGQVGCTTHVYLAVEYSGSLCFSAINLSLSTSGNVNAATFTGYGGSTSNIGFSIEGADSTNTNLTYLYFDPTASGVACITATRPTGACPAGNVIQVGSATASIVQSPTTTAQNTITVPNSSTVGLTIHGFGSTGGNAFLVTNNGWNSIYVNPFGDAYFGKDIISFARVEIDSNTSGANLQLDSLKDHIINQPTGNSDVKGTITITAATSNSYTFQAAYNSAPACVISQDSSTPSTAVSFSKVSTTTTLTVYASVSGTYSLDYICIGN